MTKEQKRGIAISTLLILCTCIVYKVRLSETYHISILFNKLSSWMQIRQIGASFFMFFIGYWELTCAKIEWGTWGEIAAAYILGTAIWGVLSMFYLCLGIPYSLIYMVAGIIVLGIITFVFLKKNFKFETVPFVCGCFIFIGIAAFASTGMMNISYGTGDSQYYIQQWGKGIAILGEINSAQHGFLTHTGLLPATFSSLVYFFGADNVYTIHHCFEICFLIFFGKIVETDILSQKQYGETKKRIFSIALTIFMYMLPPIRVLSGWIISNTYLMVYLFAVCYSFYRMFEKKEEISGQKIFTLILVIAITLLRADTPVTICMVIGCFAVCYINDVKKLWPFFVSAFFSFGVYYLKIFFMLKEQVNGIVISTQTLLLMGLCFAVLAGYMLSARIIAERISKKNIYRLLCLVFMGFNVALLLVFKNIYLENLYTVFKNTIVVEWFWGGTLPIILVGCIYIISRRKEDVFLLLGICMIIIFIDLGVLRTINGTVGAARLGVGDSINRSIISILPMLCYDFYLRLFGQNV